MREKNGVATRLFTLAGLLIFVFFLVTAVSLATAADTEDGGDQPLGFLDLYPQFTFDLPVAIVNAGDDRLFIVEQPGRIWAVEGRGSGAEKTLFLDIVDRVQDGNERGLLGLAFHPGYKQNDYFYVNYITLVDETETSRLSRFQVSADPDKALPGSELVRLEVDQPYPNHNGGGVLFDPQGMLVMALGDGGYAGDPDNNSQNPQSYLGKLLRIDVDKAQNGKNYGIPDDNPFIGQAPHDEIWALGLRNPWRFSFDRQTGDLLIGDVGQREWEEINFVPAAGTGGQNFEWSIKEGFEDFRPEQDVGPGVLTAPVFVYGHDQGRCSVIGGAVYRGASMSELDGVYVYADYCSGEIFGLEREGEEWSNRPLLERFRFLSTFGEDSSGELYFAQRSQGGYDDRDKGRIYKLGHYWRQHIPVVIAPDGT